jgi:bacitracin transport system permease protein
MGRMISCEFLKLKHSRYKMIVCLGTFAAPLLAVMLSVQRALANGKNTISLHRIYENAFLFFMLLFGPLLFAVVASYLFSREYTEKTLKTLFSTSISRKGYIFGKYSTLFLLIMILMLCSWMAVFVCAMLCQVMFRMTVLNLGALVVFLFRMVYGGILLYFAITPFGLLAIYTKGLIAPMIVAAVVALGNVILSGAPFAAYIPWAAPYMIVERKAENPASLIILIAVFLCSILMSVWKFERDDIH